MDSLNPIAYEGSDPYVFVSYCHKDEETVLPLVGAMAAAGVRVWYDSGIDPGSEWPEVIAEHLQDGAAFVAFVSKASVASHNCRREFNYAVMENKPSLIVVLEEVDMTPAMKMQMSTVQALRHSDYPTESQLVSAITCAPPVVPCVEKSARDGQTCLATARRSPRDSAVPKVQYSLVKDADGMLIQITHDKFAIGRKVESCDYVIADPSVSRVHALFHMAQGKCYIIDNNSLNQTFVNGVAVDPAFPVELADSDKIEIGDEVFTVRFDSEG